MQARTLNQATVDLSAAKLWRGTNSPYPWNKATREQAVATLIKANCDIGLYSICNIQKRYLAYEYKRYYWHKIR